MHSERDESILNFRCFLPAQVGVKMNFLKVENYRILEIQILVFCQPNMRKTIIGKVISSFFLKSQFNYVARFEIIAGLKFLFAWY